MPYLPVICQMYWEHSGEFDACVPYCRAKGRLYDQSVCPYNQGFACCTCVSRSRRPATALTAGRPLDDRRAMVRWERMAQREQETRTWGFVAWSLAVCAGYRAKPVMNPYIYVIYAACSRSWQPHHR